MNKLSEKVITGDTTWSAPHMIFHMLLAPITFTRGHFLTAAQIVNAATHLLPAVRIGNTKAHIFLRQ